MGGPRFTGNCLLRPRFPCLQNASACAGRALDVIIVTKEQVSFPENSVVTSTELEDSEHGKDKEEDDDNKGNNDGDFSDSDDEDDDLDGNNQKGGGALELKRKAAFVRGKGMRNGMQHLIGWKVGSACTDVDFFEVQFGMVIACPLQLVYVRVMRVSWTNDFRATTRKTCVCVRRYYCGQGMEVDSQRCLRDKIQHHNVRQ